MIRFAILLTLVVSNAKASDNGKYYACDTSILDSDNQCIFALTGEHKGKDLHSILETVQDFLCELGIKPPIHLMEISIFSINNVIVRLTKIMNRADKNWGNF